MKKSVLLLILFLSMGCVNSENLFQYNNPFPQTSPQMMNNIYESEPATIFNEKNKAKKSRIKAKNTEEQTVLENENSKLPVYPSINEGSVDSGNFYMFK